MKGIGGYITFGLHMARHLKPGSIALNSGRNALECLLHIRGYRVLHAPRYTCSVLRRSIERAGVELRFYDIDACFEPLIDPKSIAGDEALLYTNYFGLKDATIRALARACPTLIVDQAQAFYTETPQGTDAFDSLRKFLPVPDGSFLQLAASFDLVLERDQSHENCMHLLLGSDDGPERGFASFQANEARLDERAPMAMSNLTQALVALADHDAIKARRRANHAMLHNALSSVNLLTVDPMLSTVPMAYPLLTGNHDLRSRLIEARVYVPTYWPDLLGTLEPGSTEAMFRDQLLCLPVDQRQGPKEMERIIKLTNY